MKRLLSIDGGGIRGIIPAYILSNICNAGKFDLIAGTSTGGILACALGQGRPASDLVQMYTKRGPEIFNKAWYRMTAFEPKYTDAGIAKVLWQTLGMTRFSNSLIKLLVPAFNMVKDSPAHFKSWEDPVDGMDLMYDVARATSAAPTYFPAYKGYADGGLFANNPAMNCYAEARSLWPGEELEMLSLGTGYKPEHRKYPNYGGLAEWAKPVIGAIMDSPSHDIDYMMKVCLGDSYTRIQGELPSNVNPAMDDASEKNTYNLQVFAQSLVKDNNLALSKWRS